jgi:hypothetical protein
MNITGSPTLPLLTLFSSSDKCESGRNWQLTLEKLGVQFKQWAMGVKKPKLCNPVAFCNGINITP